MTLRKKISSKLTENSYNFVYFSKIQGLSLQFFLEKTPSQFLSYEFWEMFFQSGLKEFSIYICDVLRDLVPFVQFQKREKHRWRSVTFTPPSVFFTFLKLYIWYQIAQNITYFWFHWDWGCKCLRFLSILRPLCRSSCHVCILSVLRMMIINVTVLTSNCSIDVPAKIFVDVERYLKVEAIDIASIAGTWKLVKPNFLVIEVWALL